MRSKINRAIVSDFFLDGSKIMFGSLVVGIFIPNVAIPEFPWITFVIGIVLTIAFLMAANIAASNNEESNRLITTP